MSVTLKHCSEKSVPQLFDPEQLGSTFQEFAVDVVQGENTEFISRWFRAGRGLDADLVIWSDGSQRIIKQQICLYGQVVEWNPINGTRTGVVIEQELAEDEIASLAAPTRESGYSTTDSSEVVETIRFDSRAQDGAIQNAIRVLAAVPNLSDSDRRSLIFHLRESPKLHKKARERALQVWAPKAEEIMSNRRASIWSRMRKWFLGS